MKKSFLLASLPLILIGLALVSTVHFGLAQSGLITFINSDTIWTKENSPYTLTGPIVVSTGVTLTINPGLEVNLNGYYFFVNGTLQVIGSASDKIQISRGEISYGDNDQTGIDSIFENTIINSTISSNTPLKLNNNTINVRISVGTNSVISNNIIVGTVDAGYNTTILNNNIKGDISIGGQSTISNNIVAGDITTGKSVKILNNTIHGSRYYPSPPGGLGYTIALTADKYSIIANNTISGGIKASSSTISNNVISGGAPYTDWGGRSADSTSAVTVSGESSVTSNLIFSSTGGHGVMIRTGYAHISGNIIQNDIRVAGDALIESNLISTSGGVGIEVGHIFVSAFNDIDYGYGNSVIRNNIITNNSVGILSTKEGGESIIEHNLISDNSNGISVSSQVSILNNTITNSDQAISLRTSSATVAYNNIMDYTQNSVYLSSVPTEVNVPNNWWGTTDVQAINLTIHDFKYDLTLGKVNFVPLLTTQNDQAPPTSFSLPLPSFPSSPGIPEFPSWTILLIMMVAVVAVTVLYRRRLRN